MIKLVFTSFLSLFGLSLFGQYGTTSAGENKSVTDYSLSFTIGETINIQSVNTLYSNKTGILQPTSKISSSIKKEESLEIKIYPNPATDFIRVISQYPENLTYQMVDITGKNILRGELSNEAIDLTELQQGVYFLHLQKGDITFSEKIVKINHK